MLIARSHVKRAAFAALRWSGAERRLLARLREPGAAAILNFHRVSPHANPLWNPVHPDQFEAMLVFLKRRAHVATLAEWSACACARGHVILSFDDGYGDFSDYAMPLLHRHGLRANQNVIPACVSSANPPWVVQLYDVLQSLPRREINRLAWPGFGQELRGEDADARVRYGVALGRFLTLRPRQERQALGERVRALAAQANGSVRRTRMMTLAEVRAAAAEHEIGAHAFAHDSMGIEDDAVFLDDLARCRAFFEQELRQPLRIYAFPNGNYRPGQIDLLRSQGIERVLLVEERLARRGEAAHPRLTMHADSAVELCLRALGCRR